jgi:hypothetical protein
MKRSEVLQFGTPCVQAAHSTTSGEVDDTNGAPLKIKAIIA